MGPQGRGGVALGAGKPEALNLVFRWERKHVPDTHTSTGRDTKASGRLASGKAVLLCV